MTVIHNKALPALIVGAIALAGAACTKDNMTGDGNMMSDTGSTHNMDGDNMNKMDTDKKMSPGDGMMKNQRS